MSDEFILFDDFASAQNTLLAVISYSSRNLYLYASLIDPALFDSTDCVAAFSGFARSSRIACLKILIEDHKLFAIRNPSLLDLAQRLTGRIEIRSVPLDVRAGSDCYLIGDQQSVWCVPDIGIMSGTCEKSNRVRAQKLTEHFVYLWERSKQPEDFRRLDF